MELLWTALFLGLVGSLHCAVMCGPLTLAVVRLDGSRTSLSKTRLVYHAGRLTIYTIIGAIFGALGQTFALAGLQRWLSIIAGLAILICLFSSSRASLKLPVAKLVIKLKTAFATLLSRRTLAAQFALGSLNGLLPCGLVYIAAAGAATTLSPAMGALHMLVFGIGTLPMLLGLSGMAGRVSHITRRTPKLVGICVAVVAILLVLRGLSLGVPYLSPALAASEPAHCH